MSDYGDYDSHPHSGDRGTATASHNDWNAYGDDNNYGNDNNYGSDYGSRSDDDSASQGSDSHSEGSDSGSSSGSGSGSENLPHDENDASEDSDDDINTFYHDSGNELGSKDDVQRRKRMMLGGVCCCCIVILGVVLGITFSGGSSKKEAPVEAPPPTVPPTSASPTMAPVAPTMPPSMMPTMELAGTVIVEAGRSITLNPGNDTVEDAAMLTVGQDGSTVELDFDLKSIPDVPVPESSVYSDEFPVGGVFYQAVAMLRMMQTEPVSAPVNMTLRHGEEADIVDSVVLAQDGDGLEMDVTSVVFPSSSKRRGLQEKNSISFLLEAAGGVASFFSAGAPGAPRIVATVAKIRKDGPGNFTVVDDGVGGSGSDFDDGNSSADDDTGFDGQNSTEVPSSIELIVQADASARDGEFADEIFGDDDALLVQFHNSSFQAASLLVFDAAQINAIPEGSAYLKNASLTLHHVANVFQGGAFSVAVARIFVDLDEGVNIENMTYTELAAIFGSLPDHVEEREVVALVDPMDKILKIDVSSLLFIEKNATCDGDSDGDKIASNFTELPSGGNGDVNATDSDPAGNATDGRPLDGDLTPATERILFLLTVHRHNGVDALSATFRSREFDGGAFAPRIDVDVREGGCDQPADPRLPMLVLAEQDGYVAGAELDASSPELKMTAGDSRILIAFGESDLPDFQVRPSVTLRLSMAALSNVTDDLKVDLWGRRAVARDLSNATAALLDTDPIAVSATFDTLSGLARVDVTALVYPTAVNGRRLRGRQRYLQDAADDLVISLEFDDAQLYSATFHSLEGGDTVVGPTLEIDVDKK